jgi:hypothetical protein
VSSKQGLTFCSLCSSGKFSNQGATYCSNCTLGLFSSTNSSSCTQCPAGFFSNDTGLSTCYSCPSGLTTPNPGASQSSECSSCSPGNIRTQLGCVQCPVGKFWQNQSCPSCGAGLYASRNASLTCDPCPIGRWSSQTNVNSSSNCNPCPEAPGADCPAGSLVPFVKAGWFRDAGTGPDVLLQCFPLEACAQAGFGNTNCSTGYSGRACSSCSQNYFRLGERCRLCLPAWARWILIILALFLVIVACWKLTTVQDRIPLIWKISFSWIQFLALFIQLSDNWPLSLQRIFDCSNFFNFELQYFGFSCDKGISFWSVWLMKVFMPTILFVSILICFRIRAHLDHVEQTFYDILQTRTGPILYSLMIFSTIIYSSLFEVFNCVQQGDGSFVLTKDPSIVCYTSQWRSYMILDLLFIVLYVLAPLVFAVFHFGRIGLKRVSVGENTRIFTRCYRDGCEYWEITRLLFKLVFVVLRDTSSLERASKTLVLLGVLIFQLYVENRIQPFRDPIVGHTSAR